MSKNEKYLYAYDPILGEKPPGFGQRHLQVGLMFLVLFICYAIRTAMSVAVLAMVETQGNNLTIDHTIFDWDKKTQDLILSAFYFGYASMQIPAAILAFHFGAWFLLATTMTVNTVLCLSLPWFAEIGGWKAMCIIRALMGVTQGFLFPCLHTLIGKWVPLCERGRLSYVVYCGVAVGTIVSQPLAGYLSTSNKGWPSVFYIHGLAALIVAILWLVFGSSSPDKHSGMSFNERRFIAVSLSLSSSSAERPTKTPWKDILTSQPVWAVVLTHVIFNWTFVLMLMETPSFMKHVLNINIQESGVLSGIPYIANWMVGFVASVLTDYAINNNIITTITSRKIWNSIGLWGPSLFMLLLAFVPQGKAFLSVTLIAIIIGLSGATNSGFVLSHMDISTNFAGVLMSIANTLANIVGIFAPISSGYILNGQESDTSRWRMVFLFAASLTAVGNLIYLTFVTADSQDWNGLTTSAIDVELTELQDEVNEARKLSKQSNGSSASSRKSQIP